MSSSLIKTRGLKISILIMLHLPSLNHLVLIIFSFKSNAICSEYCLFNYVMLDSSGNKTQSRVSATLHVHITTCLYIII